MQPRDRGSQRWLRSAGRKWFQRDLAGQGWIRRPACGTVDHGLDCYWHGRRRRHRRRQQKSNQESRDHESGVNARADAAVSRGHAASGVAKLAGRTWRSGKAVAEILSTSSYGHPFCARFLHPNSALSKALCYSTVAFEVLFPFVLTIGRPWVFLVLAGGLALHLSVAFAMGLNCFRSDLLGALSSHRPEPPRIGAPGRAAPAAGSARPSGSAQPWRSHVSPPHRRSQERRELPDELPAP